jgi:hypothetical protein
MKKAFLSAALLLATAAVAAPSTDITDQYKAGDHNGELKQLAVSVDFTGAYGHTVTNAQGTTYNFWGASIFEPKVYLSQYWGDFPLYFFGLPVHADVSVSNLGPRQSFKLRVTTQTYALNLDGTNGVKLAPDVVKDFVVNKGETQNLDMSFTPQFVPGADSGLDRFVILVQHPNEGGNGNGNGANDLPALILAKEAILCPPAVEAAGKAANAALK